MWLNWQCSSSLLDTNQIALKLCISDNRWCLNLQFTLLCGALFIQFLELLMKKICARSGFFFEFGAADGFIWSEISQGFQKYSNFVCRTKIGGLIDKKPDFFWLFFWLSFDYSSFHSKQSSGQAQCLEIQKYCPRISKSFFIQSNWKWFNMPLKLICFN